MKCPKCNSGWRIEEDHSYCGWCGSKVRSIDLALIKPEGEILLYADSSETIHFELDIINNGIKDVRIDKPKLELKKCH